MEARVASELERSEVVLGVSGPFAAGERQTLAALLVSELETLGLTLVEHDPAGSDAGWVEEVTAPGQRLLAVLIDAREGGLRLVIIDAARRRAISRKLPAGIESNRASIEALVSIVTSAASALREGLEVASAPVETVVGEADPPPSESESRDRPPSPPAANPPEPPDGDGIAFHGGIGAIWASLTREPEHASFGGVVTGGVTPVRWLTVEASIGRHLPVAIESELGRFELVRTSVGLYLGPPLGDASLIVTPELGFLLDWLERTGTQPAPGVAASPERTLRRIGGGAVLRLRYELTGPLALGAGAGLSLFGPARFRAGALGLAEASSLVASLELGLLVASDP